MSTLTALARAEAVAAGRAQRTTTVRHLHLGARPLVVIPLAMAGEANAPLAALVGTDRDSPRLLFVPQPRNRDQRFGFAAELAGIVLPYLTGFRGVAEAVAVNRGKEVRHRYVDAPQLLVPNSTGIQFIRLFGRSTRFRRTDGDYPVHPSVPVLGRWLTFLADRAEHPGSCLLLGLTEALTAHWATGQSPLEDNHLPALLGWIDPPPGLTGAEAAALAEDPVSWPPAGPLTDPTFDNEVLAPAIADYEEAADDPVRRARAADVLADALRSQLEPTWRLMWQGLDLLRALPPGGRVEQRWAEDRDAFTNFILYLEEGGFPQPRRDGAVTAATRLHRLERALQSYAVQRAYDDPLVMADHRLSGEAFVGTVVLADPNRIDDSGKRRVLRPRIMLRTSDPVQIIPGAAVFSPDRPQQKARVVFVNPASDGSEGTELVLELTGGLGRALTPAPGSVPEVGNRLCYTTLSDGFMPPGEFPDREQTPWTHGGPPTAYEEPVEPTADDAREEWA
ncbi:hypothetical protein [Plantactinospora sp. B24E8]|uniref:hypothetical protein n=1 Tax=Plantactinospora sp. B24E8 TaxID=3153567 RepID=UPI00325E5674